MFPPLFTHSAATPSHVHQQQGMELTRNQAYDAIANILAPAPVETNGQPYYLPIVADTNWK